MKIELKHYTSYLPYELQVKDPETLAPGVMVSICTGMIGLLLYEDKDNIEYYEPHQVKPILRPMSDLHKEIEFNGNKIIPIVELGKIAFYTSNITNKYHAADEQETDGTPWLYAAQWNVGKRDSVAPDEKAKLVIYPSRTVFTGFTHPIHLQHRQYVHGSWHTHPVNQTQTIIQKMAEMNFDYMGLIPAGVAIDINSLHPCTK